MPGLTCADDPLRGGTLCRSGRLIGVLRSMLEALTGLTAVVVAAAGVTA